MKSKIIELISAFIKTYEQSDSISTRWGEPLVGFADANHPYIFQLRDIVSPSHGLPADVLDDATIVISYFVPFTKELADTNKAVNEPASAQWARAYEETNAMFPILNAHIISELEKFGYRAAVSPEATSFNREKLISNWSHRHFAKAAGLGTFGINNMLITKSGCCGRYNSVVTNLDIQPDAVLETEYCLYKKNGTCGVCMKFCPTGALTPDKFDREKCYAVCLKNAHIHTEYGNSYVGIPSDPAEESELIGSEVCGKCVVNAPCRFW